MLYKYIRDNDIVLFVKDFPNSLVKRGMFGYYPEVDTEDGYLYLQFPEQKILNKESDLMAFSPQHHKRFIRFHEDLDLDELLNSNKEDILAVVYSPKYRY